MKFLSLHRVFEALYNVLQSSACVIVQAFKIVNATWCCHYPETCNALLEFRSLNSLIVKKPYSHGSNPEPNPVDITSELESRNSNFRAQHPMAHVDSWFVLEINGKVVIDHRTWTPEPSPLTSPQPFAIPLILPCLLHTILTWTIYHKSQTLDLQFWSFDPETWNLITTRKSKHLAFTFSR